MCVAEVIPESVCALWPDRGVAKPLAGSLRYSVAIRVLCTVCSYVHTHPWLLGSGPPVAIYKGAAELCKLGNPIS